MAPTATTTAAATDFEFDIYVPMTNNKGQKYAESLLQKYKQKLIEKFGGLTDTRIKNEGTWKTGRVVQHDEIVIWRALSHGADEREFMTSLKEAMAQEFQQEEILVICRQVQVL